MNLTVVWPGSGTDYDSDIRTRSDRKNQCRDESEKLKGTYRYRSRDFLAVDSRVVPAGHHLVPISRSSRSSLKKRNRP